MIKRDKGIIIAFEGMDCSFKETNYNEFVRRMKEAYNPENIFTESFPRYNNTATDNVKKWLSGKFDRDHLMKYPLAVNSLYSIDRLSYWFEYDENNEKRIDLLKNVDNFFIFDRYNFSNSIYNPRSIKYGHAYTSIKDFQFDITTFGIPNPHITVWMRMKNFDVLADIMSKKENKDKNETDLKYIREVWERLESVINHNYCIEFGIRSVVIECLDENDNIRSKEDIANDVWTKVSAEIADMIKED